MNIIVASDVWVVHDMLMEVCLENIPQCFSKMLRISGFLAVAGRLSGERCQDAVYYVEGHRFQESYAFLSFEGQMGQRKHD